MEGSEIVKFIVIIVTSFITFMIVSSRSFQDTILPHFPGLVKKQGYDNVEPNTKGMLAMSFVAVGLIAFVYIIMSVM